MTTLALALAVLQVGAGPRDLGVILAAGTIPTLLFLLVGGAVADRFSRKRLLVGTNLASGVVMAALAVVFVSERYSLTAVVGLVLIKGILEGINSPALRGLVPEFVAKPDLQKANAMLASSRNATRIIAPAVAAMIVAGPGGGWALALDAGTYILAGLIFLKMPATKSTPVANQSILVDHQRWVEYFSFYGLDCDHVTFLPRH